MQFLHTKAKVANRGYPPDEFLNELVVWGRGASSVIFAPRPRPDFGPDLDIYALVKPVLGPWQNFLHRRAAMLEVMRVHAGFESSWNWNEGVDITNHTSMTHIEGQETGIFQVSYDSLYINHGAMKPFAADHGINSVCSFISQMKSDHVLAMEYYSRLVRINTNWAGPLKRHEIDQYLSRDAVLEFEELLA
jgi:hypothetical protein